MKSLLWPGACCVAGCLLGLVARAQVPEPPPAPAAAAAPAAASAPAVAAAGLTLREALDAAWTRALAARETEGQRRRAEADLAVARSLWAAPPALELSHRDDRLHGGQGSRETEVGMALPLWLPGQRAARGAAAGAAVTQAQAAEQVARWRLAGAVREAAWELAALQAELTQAEGLAQALQSLAEDVSRRVQAGDLAPADSLAARAEQLAAVAQQAAARQRLQAAQAGWTLLTGLESWPALVAEEAEAADDAPAAAPAGAADAVPAVTGLHPELGLARQSTALAREQLALLQRSRRDAPELMLGLRQSTPGPAAASQGSLAVALRLPFGTTGRNQPLEAAALGALDLAQAREQRLREQLDSETRTARAALRAARVQLQAERARAQLLRERAALIEQSLRAGESPLPELLRALSAAAQADAAVARHTAALGLARARLDTTLGLLP